ncbi:MAG: hypothetical protein VX733_10350 [Candidatus Latescibacterota bacterium]|nr:hypothetical protein [Candidatus Latescibacterota bacterium]
MSLLTCSSLPKNYVAYEVFSAISDFRIKVGDRIGQVGLTARMKSRCCAY